MHFIFVTRTYKPNSNIGLIKNCLRGMFMDSEHTYLHLIVADLSHGYMIPLFKQYQDRNTRVCLVGGREKKDIQDTIGIDKAVNHPIASMMYKPEDCYVYVLDDDNLPHPCFLNVVNYINGDEDAIVFKVAGRPELGNSSIMNERNSIGYIDWANFITRLPVMRKLGVYDKDGTRCEDGIFFQKLKDNHLSVRFTEEVLGFYNRIPRI